LDSLRAQSDHFEIIESWQRASLKPSGKFSEWMQNNFDQKRRKEFKRLRNRLSEQGTLVTEILKIDDDTKSFVDEFLALEAAGWKGKKGTAINAIPHLTESFYEACKSLHEEGKLRFWSLKLNGKAIASLFAIVEGEQAWLGKIAYDEFYAKYSPGVMIILDCTESFFAEPAITQIDSCAIPDHPMIDRIWRNRLPMVSVFVAPASISQTHFNLVVTAENLRMLFRNTIRDFYYTLRGVKRS
jgi:CelD/BcsL family acetyltransferase involved in cellulose biosynthesis